MNNTHDSIIISVLGNKVLLKHIISFQKEQRDIHISLGEIKGALHLYKHFNDTQTIIDYGYHSLLSDRIKSGHHLRFNASSAESLCRKVTDIDIFTTVYNDKRIYFTNPKLLLTAIQFGNLTALITLLKQVYPVDLANHYTIDDLIDKAVTSYQYDIAKFLIDEFCSSNNNNNNEESSESIPTLKERFQDRAKQIFENPNIQGLPFTNLIFLSASTLDGIELILQQFKIYFPSVQELQFDVDQYFSNAVNDNSYPMTKWIQQLYCLCKVYGLIESVDQFHRQCDELLQRSISKSNEIIENYKTVTATLVDNIVKPDLQTMNNFVQLTMLIKLCNDGNFPIVETHDIKHILQRSTSHAYIIPFLLDIVLESKTFNIILQDLLDSSPSFDGVIIGCLYNLPSGLWSQTVYLLQFSHWIRQIKIAIIKGDLLKLKTLLSDSNFNIGADQSSMSVLIKLAIDNEKINIFEYLIVEKGAVDKNIWKTIGVIGNSSFLQLLCKSPPNNDFNSLKKMFKLVHKEAISSDLIDPIRYIFDQYEEYEKMYWYDAINSGSIEMIGLYLNRFRHNEELILSHIKTAIEHGQIEIYQLLVDNLKGTLINDRLTPNIEPESQEDELYPMYLYRLKHESIN
ncbi:hypothetical protein PPL_10583 [Heterostelium album PN500]|uniref:Ankyrin repeat-containing protein n=1 Tax=Heterostelium pallidum (strain ATCC 26659 / Pp 5 / PN500) TaxID=670386 RepID=D3BRH2_HETP5|nr:hypothetical protein PPL_10583 [Heterostelium album PN500]EFA76004.1 hypothetical protein PPL_10583 [Heterostelium album PN500]|eukprot:XP_020428138.1 hypothetical protein PPL_10583 [Heterostelium album PN500]